MYSHYRESKFWDLERAMSFVERFVIKNYCLYFGGSTVLQNLPHSDKLSFLCAGPYPLVREGSLCFK